MDYREYAKDLLRRKNHICSASEALRDEISGLEKEKYECKANIIGGLAATKSERDKYEERYTALCAHLEDCRFRLRVVERELKMIENGMSGLSEYYRELLTGFFIDNKKGAADRLMERFYKERSCLYADRNKALETFTRSVYGVVML